MKIIDISTPLEEAMPVWPKSSKPHFRQLSDHRRGDLWTETEISMNLHTGTHIDSPLHRIKNGEPIDMLPLETLIGPAFVAFLPKIKTITSRDLENLNLPRGTSRLLFKTDNSIFWKNKEKKFKRNFIGLSPDGALWLTENKIKLIGNDYLSIAQFDKQPEVHRILLEKKIILIEGLNLSAVKQGAYKLICLPIKLVGTEAAPTRVILVR